ncbi:hypothetical protein ACFQDF_19260 [Ectobacillus funiculus]
MSEIVLNSQHIFRKEAGRTSLKQNEYLNLPDLQFFNWCNQQYRLNRGIYNTIDEWFIIMASRKFFLVESIF